MRYLKLISILILFACHTEPEAYSYEDTILECFYKQHEEMGKDAKASISQLEKIFIKHGVLKSSMGESYIELLNAMKSTNTYPFEISDDLIKDINSISYLPSDVSCVLSGHQLPDSVGYQNSKLKHIPQIMDSLDEISIKSISEEILKVYHKNDFNHGLYKSIGIVVLANQIKNHRRQKIDGPFIY